MKRPLPRQDKAPRVNAGTGGKEGQAPVADGPPPSPSAAAKIVTAAKAITRVAVPSGALKHAARLLGKK